MSSTIPQPPPSHAWSQATSDSSKILPGSRTKIVEHALDNHDDETCNNLYSTTAAPILVPIVEVEQIVESLQPFPVEEIGSSAFMHMYCYQVERLSLQAHATAQRASQFDGDEYVVEALLTFGKLSTLVRTLLAVEAWRTFVLSPRNNDNVHDGRKETEADSADSTLLPRLAKNGNSMRCAFILHAETTLVSLLNLILYRKESCEEMDGETSVALVDYCARQMTSLAMPAATNEMVRRQKNTQSATELTQRLQTRTPTEEIVDVLFDTEFKTAVAATSLARYLCEHIESLALGAQTRILDTHDFLVMMVPLIEEPPWTRRRKNVSKQNNLVWEKLMDDNYEWKEVPPSDLLQITKCEAQCWLTIFHLIGNNTCRERYYLNTFRKEQLLRLRKYLNDVMLDQLPVLADVMRYMDELSFMNVPESGGSTGQGSAFLMQQIAILRDSLIRGRVWKDVSRRQFDEIFSKVTDAKDAELRLIADIYTENNFVESFVGNGTILEHVYEPMAEPLDGITIIVATNGIDVDAFSLTQKVKSSKVIQTPHGQFRRTKLKVCSLEENDEKKVMITSTSVIKANASFQSSGKFTKLLQCSMKVIDGDGEKDSFSDVSTKKWLQLGSLQEKIIIQLGFKCRHLDGCTRNDADYRFYELEQAFLSQPFVDDERWC